MIIKILDREDDNEGDEDDEDYEDWDCIGYRKAPN